MCVFVFYTISILAYVKIKELVHYVYAAESKQVSDKARIVYIKKGK